LPGPHSREGP